MTRETPMQTISRLYALAKANKYLLVISVVVVSLFVVMRNAVTKMVLTEMTEFELYAAQAIVRTIIAPIIVFIMWRAGTVRFDRMLKLSPMAKGVILASTLLGIIIFFLSVTILKQNMLTKVVTLHTAFQIILACLIGYVLFNEKLEAREMLGIFLILVGMGLMYSKDAKGAKGA
jgi:drug/metabolite transporter (DMT)-like permease